MDATKQDGCDVMHNFKARPLNKKVIFVSLDHLLNVVLAMPVLDLFPILMQIFSSKGDIGVFRNNKREATVPMVVYGCLSIS
jgi:hypothetical protein